MIHMSGSTDFRLSQICKVKVLLEVDFKVAIIVAS